MNTDILYLLINTPFNLIEQKNEFFSKMNIQKDETIHNFIAKYYFYINLDKNTCIPFNIFINIISNIPIIKRSEGNICECNNCQFYCIFDNKNKQKNKYSSFSSFKEFNSLKKLIPDFILQNKTNNYIRKQQKNEINEETIFIDQHNKLSPDCKKMEIIKYSSIENFTKKIKKIIKSLYTSELKIDRKLKIESYIHLIICKLNAIDEKNNKQTNEKIFSQITTFVNSFLQKNKDTYILIPIYAAFTYIVINGFHKSNKLRTILKNTDDKKWKSNSNYPIKLISNMFAISKPTIYKNINPLLKFIKENK